MSNALALAAVTATLAHALGEALAAQGAGGVPNVHVTTLRPDLPAATGPNARGVNVFLYQVTPNAAWRGDGLPARRTDGAPLAPPQQALDLHYLLTFSGDEGDLEPQRLLGVVVNTINARPVLTRQLVRRALEQAVASGDAPYLEFADLADQMDVVRLTMLPLSLEELSKLWSTFFQVPYRLSVTYQGSVVLLTSDIGTRNVLPVRERHVEVAPFRAVEVTRVLAASGADDPITAGTKLRIEGSGLGGETTRVRVTGVEEPIKADQAADTHLTVALPADIRAGVHGLQVGRDAVESRTVPVVVRPVIAPGGVRAAPGAPGTVDVTVPISPRVGRRQRVVLLLNGHGAASPRSYRFVVPPRGDAEVSDPDITVVTKGVEAGDYLVRVQVDGAESPLGGDTGKAYDRPKVTFP
ncbi:DUF4255 domain-containing protein [Streptomyces sp. A2-16]|uniref:DUF4255 domain-containing protein n=1 Tax=Streptomyces sp. A2-16 TaxID=2781734 RepID=UPI001BAE7F6C|nr:DUF4255 domain-containing protein [Streptomyces sp. A2-16]QUC58069.1 DUF4255 domain-containing protein [Streptomyces sp. A2-16]